MYNFDTSNIKKYIIKCNIVKTHFCVIVLNVYVPRILKVINGFVLRFCLEYLLSVSKVVKEIIIFLNFD